eukprot:1601835-Pleurochrysis_carterae.AAC.1
MAVVLRFARASTPRLKGGAEAPNVRTQLPDGARRRFRDSCAHRALCRCLHDLSLIHISEPTRRTPI